MRKEFLLFGASGSLGKGALNNFLERGYDHNYIIVRDSSKIKLNNNTTIIESGDLSIEENVKAVFDVIKPGSEKLFFLFTTIGGYTGGKPVWEIEYSEWLKMLNINLNISFLISKYFSKLVQSSAGGCICFSSALTSLRPEANKSAYIISKNALNMLVKVLSIEGKRINLSANAIAPFAIDTEENREWVKDPAVLVTPEEISGLVCHLFDDFRMISGSIIELPQKMKF